MTATTFQNPDLRLSASPQWALIAEVDAAVRSVLETQDRRSQPERRTAGGDLEVFPGRLLGLKHAESFAKGLSQVGVATGTVVTPLARDLLKKRGIAIRLVSRGEFARVRNPGEWGFAVESGAESGTVAALRRTWLEDDWTELEASLEGAARWVVEVPDRGALVVSDEASLAVWRACQVAGVRAASVADIDATARAVRYLGANLLVVEPSGKSISWMRQIGLSFRRAGAPMAPEAIEREEGSRCGSPR